MKTLTADDQKRVRLPDAQPRQKFAYEHNEDGSIRLIPVVIQEPALPKAKLVRRGGRTFAETTRTITTEDVQRVTETFP